MLQTVYKLDDKDFVINHWSPTKVYKNLPVIGKYFAVPVSMAFTSGESMGDGIPSAVLYLFSEMEENDIMDLFEIVLNDTHFAGNEVFPQIDSVFAESAASLIKLVTKVLEVNYAGFFKEGGLPDLFKMVVPMAQMQLSPDEI